MRPWLLSLSGWVVGNSLWEMILLYQSAIYKAPSGPNSIFTGRNQSSSDVNKSGKCSDAMLPSGFLMILTALIVLVIGLAKKATSRTPPEKSRHHHPQRRYLKYLYPRPENHAGEASMAGNFLCVRYRFPESLYLAPLGLQNIPNRWLPIHTILHFLEAGNPKYYLAPHLRSPFFPHPRKT